MTTRKAMLSAIRKKQPSSLCKECGTVRILGPGQLEIGRVTKLTARESAAL
jgi:hypothetical protein